MKKILIALFCLSSYVASKAEDPKPEEVKKPQICWECIELYDDSDFKKKMPEDSKIMKSYRKKLPKYQKRVKEELKKVFEAEGMELVECPTHKVDGSALKQVTAEDKPLHMKISLAYNGLIWITVYTKIEIYRGDQKVITFKKEKTAFILDVDGKEERQRAVTEFAKEITKTLVEKVRELKPEEK
ncbi:MAG: hypothetical protein Q7S83_04245 [bacterium]|nr:hypothetical protein [bacterium]